MPTVRRAPYAVNHKKMGWLLRFIFFSLLLTWVYNQLVRPLFDGLNHNKKVKPQPKSKPEAKKEIQIEYRKFPPNEGDYVDYEELK